MVNQIYPPELQLNNANASDTESPFLDLHLSGSNGFVSTKLYDKRDDFDSDKVNFLLFHRCPYYGVYISQLIMFARVCSHVTDFNVRNKSSTPKLLQQGYRYHNLRNAFSILYRRLYSAFISDWIFFILAGSKNSHRNLDVFEIWPDTTTDCG